MTGLRVEVHNIYIDLQQGYAGLALGLGNDRLEG